MKENQKAEEFYKLATVAETSKIPGIMSYYQGLSFLELNNKTKAVEIFENLIENGDNIINKSSEGKEDFFAIFGEQEDENIKNSQAYTLRGLGYKGLNKKDQAKEDLTKAVELSVSNLWAKSELKKFR